ncbi:MAG: serine/threonine-protein kinase [Myxococcota bacterium]|nr:serine/threonine-protein kinase [Myxococcota bacterium]
MPSVPNLTAQDVEAAVAGVRDVAYLAKGGQKIVFSCTIDGRACVLKFLLAAPPDAPPPDDPAVSAERGLEALERARREVETMSQCDSPALVKLGPLGLERTTIGNQDLIYFSEERVDGEDLRSVLSREHALAVRELVALGEDLTAAVAAIWSFAKIHRDIKPGNAMRRNSDRRFVLLDVGMAMDLADDSITATGAVVGTPAYFSPEQLDYAKRRQLDFRSDLFAAGIVLYECSTGRHPFRAPGEGTATLFGNILSARPTSPRSLRPDLPAELEAIILRLLAKRPHMRYRTCDQLATALRGVPR